MKSFFKFMFLIFIPILCLSKHNNIKNDFIFVQQSHSLVNIGITEELKFPYFNTLLNNPQAESAITTGTVTGSPFCADETLNIPFTSSGTFSIGYKLYAQLSNELGNFSNPLMLDSITGSETGVFSNVKIPPQTTQGSNYRVRVISNDPVVIGSDNGTDLQINALPVPSITGNDESCENQLITYLSNNTSGHSSKWSANGGNIFGSSSDTICRVLWGNQGNASLKLIQTNNTSGCRDSIEKQIIINPLPVTTIIGKDSVCLNSIETYKTEFNDDITYEWLVLNGQILGSDSDTLVNVLWYSLGSGSITLQVTNNTTGCFNNNSKLITVNTLPEPEFFGEDSVCENTRAIYSTEYTQGHSYQWIAEGGTVLGDINDTLAIVEWDHSGKAALKLIETINNTGCGDTSVLNVQIVPIPYTNISGKEFVIIDSTELYTSITEANIKSQWFVSGGEITGRSDRDSLTVKWGNNDFGNIILTKTNIVTGCKDTAFTKVLITDRPLPFLQGDSISCISRQESYITTDNQEFKITWTVKGGEMIKTGFNNEIYVIWDELGAGNVKALIKNEEKKYNDSVTKVVFVNKLPTVTFHSPVREICMNELKLILSGGFPTGGIYSGISITDGTFHPIQAGVGKHIINYTYNDANNCESSAIDSIFVNEIPPTPIIKFENGKLISSDAESYEWFINSDSIPVSLEKTFEPEEDGTYYVVTANQKNCKNRSSTLKISINDVAYNTIQKNQISLTPNPVTGKACLSFSVDKEVNIKAYITNILGYMELNLLDNQYFETGIHRIEFDSGELQSGIHFCSIIIGGQRYTIKFLIME